MSRAITVRYAAAIAVLLGLSVAACATNPATGERMLSLISESQEIAMGQQYSEQIAATMPAYDDEELQSYVEEIGLRLAATSERPDLPWQFTVLDDAAVNAFAVPGGFLYVTRGILTHFNSEAELAAVLGHEIGHVTARHSVEQMSRQQLLGGLLMAGAVFSEDVRGMAGLGATAIGIFGLSHSRSDEHQADQLGVRYALRDSYDPREAIKVHTMLGRQTELRGGRGIPNWLATHPSSADRIERIQAQVDEIPAETLAGTRVLPNEFLAQVDGVTFGLDPREGFFQGGRFLHPDLRFELTFPDGWQTANLTQAVIAQSPNEDAVIQLTLSSEGHQQAAREFFGQQGVQTRSQDRTTINDLPATVGTFQVATQQGETIRGSVGFIDYGDQTYHILAYTLRNRFDSYQNLFRSTIRSFDRLTDRDALNVQPLRIDVINVPRATTLAALHEDRGSPLSVDELALINGLEADAMLSRDDRIKWVVGELPPEG